MDRNSKTRITLGPKNIKALNELYGKIREDYEQDGMLRNLPRSVVIACPLVTSADDNDAKQPTFIDVKSLKATYHHHPKAHEDETVRSSVGAALCPPGLSVGIQSPCNAGPARCGTGQPQLSARSGVASVSKHSSV